MNGTAIPPPVPLTLSGTILDQVEAEIARLVAVRDLLRGSGPAIPPSPAPCSCHADRDPSTAAPKTRPAATPKSPPTAGSKRERQLRLARHILAHGPMTFGDIRQFLQVSNDVVSKVVRSPWFQKQGGATAGTTAPWELTPAGRAVVTRSEPPPVPDDDRHNPDLDEAFGDLFMGVAAAGKASPVRLSPSRTGPAHTNGPTERSATTLEPTPQAVLRLLAEEGQLGFTALCAALPARNEATVNKALNTLLAKGWAVKAEEGHRSPWSITPAGREALARIDQGIPVVA